MDNGRVIGITPNRAIFLYHLRVNPLGTKQITGQLRATITGPLDEVNEGRCALGLGCQAFNVSLKSDGSVGPYLKMAEILQISQTDVDEIWRMNDRYYATFEEIADACEKLFTGEVFRLSECSREVLDKVIARRYNNE